MSTIVSTETILEDRLHDQSAVRRGSIRAVGDSAVVWINSFEVVTNLMDDGTVQVTEKVVSFRREVVKVGDIVLGIPVTQIDEAWIAEEKKILGWK